MADMSQSAQSLPARAAVARWELSIKLLLGYNPRPGGVGVLKMQYRREIDGLRSVAVIPVILFHAGFQWFSGGFVGVDIFFVISGYLITRILLTEIQSGSFTFSGFYERRARRLLPALFVVLLACLPAAWILLFPEDMEDFARSLRSVPLFISNIYFNNSSGYFDSATELKPLLHTWSLAVEEQFYLIFPVFLIVVLKFGVRWALVLVSIVLCASLFLQMLIRRHTSLRLSTSFRLGYGSF